MNLLAAMKCGWRVWGQDYKYRSSCVIFYTDGRLACSPRVLELRLGLQKKRRKRRFVVHPFSSRVSF